MRKRLFLVAAIFVILVGQLWANGTQEAEDETVELTFQAWITPNLPLELWEDAVARFEELNPGVDVTIIQPTGGESTADNFLQTLLAAGDFPDVVRNFTVPDFVAAGALLPIPRDEQINSVRGLDELVIDGTLYGVSAQIQPHGLMFYNKDAFDEAGITELPETWDEMIAAGEALKEVGYTPISGSGDWVSGYQLSLLGAGTVFTENPEWYGDKNQGNVTFQEDWAPVLEVYATLVRQDHFPDGHLGLTYPDAEAIFVSGEAGMYPMGSWFTATPALPDAEFEVGVFPIPTQSPNNTMVALTNRSAFAVGADTEHPEMAIKLAKFFVFDEVYGTELLKADGLFSAHVPPRSYDMTPLQDEVAALLEEADMLVNHFNHPVGGQPVPGIADSFTSAAQAVINNPDIDLDEVLATMDEYWERNM